MLGCVSGSLGCPGAGHGSPAAAWPPDPCLSFPTTLPSSPWYQCLNVRGCGVTVIAGTCPVAPHSLPWPRPGAHDQQGIAVAEPCRSSGAGKPSPWPTRDVWLCHLLPCGAFPLPGVSQTLATSIAAGRCWGWWPRGSPAAGTLCLWAHPRARAEPSLRTRVLLVLFRGRPQVNTAPLTVRWGQPRPARAGVGASGALLAETAASGAACSFLPLPVLPWPEHWGHRLA